MCQAYPSPFSMPWLNNRHLLHMKTAVRMLFKKGSNSDGMSGDGSSMAIMLDHTLLTKCWSKLVAVGQSGIKA